MQRSTTLVAASVGSVNRGTPWTLELAKQLRSFVDKLSAASR